MVIILGLGNPGSRYMLTRHNVGFLVIDRLSLALKISLCKVGCNSFYGRSESGGQSIVLGKPMTYMNRSGVAARSLCSSFCVSPEHLMVVHDDLDLPEGRLRLRHKGGSGGHKGIESIIYHLGTDQFPRLRIGIGRPEEGSSVSDYVLENCSPAVEENLDLAVSACLTFFNEGIDRAMNLYNNKT